MNIPRYLNWQAGLMCLTVVSLLLSSCASTKKAATLDKRPDCSCSLEGYFETKAVWSDKAPALINKINETFYGEIIEINDEGVLFDKTKSSPFYDPEPYLIPYNEIKSLIDENRNVIYGEIPKQSSTMLSMELYLSD